ncbi:MAG: caspase family protein [Pseudomonadota bacterium]
MLQWFGRAVSSLLVVALAACAQTQRPATPNEVLGDDLPRTALVIGNGAYQRITALDNPSNDAGAIAAALRGAGYKVHRGGALTDLGRDEMQAVVDEFAAEIRQRGGIAFIYYAGHGLQVDGQNYLIPVDADIGSTADIRSETVDLQDLLKAVAATNVQMKVIVIDACRDNPFEAIAQAESGARGDVQLAAASTDSNLRTLSSGLSQVIAPPGALLAFATAPGSVALDGTPGAKNSPYAEALVSLIEEPGLRIEDAFIAIRNRVRAATNGRQTPWETSSLTAVAALRDRSAGESSNTSEQPRRTPRSQFDGVYLAQQTCEPSGLSAAYRVNLYGGDIRIRRKGGSFKVLDISINQVGDVSVVGSLHSTEPSAGFRYTGFLVDGVSRMTGKIEDEDCTFTLTAENSRDNPLSRMRLLETATLKAILPDRELTNRNGTVRFDRSGKVSFNVTQGLDLKREGNDNWLYIADGLCGEGPLLSPSGWRQCWRVYGNAGRDSTEIAMTSRVDGRTMFFNVSDRTELSVN